MLNHRNRRSAEGGQVLIMALAFIAFFSVVVVAIFRMGDVTNLQHVLTESTAVKDATAEGGAALAAADSGRSDLSLTCSVVAGVGSSGGTITMKDGHTASYTAKSCNPGTSSGSSSSAPGANCILCILNLTGADAATPVVSLGCAQCGTDLTTTGGDVYINGSIAKGSSITATASTTPHIKVLSGFDSVDCICSPAATSFAPAIPDPLSSLGAPSPAATGKPVGCLSWNAANGCSLTLSGGSFVMNPGVWATVKLSGSAVVTMTPGVYAFTDQLNFSGQGSLTGLVDPVSHLGVTIFLTCPGYGTGGALCPNKGGTGGFISLGSQGTTSITAPGSTQYKSDNIAILADPHLLDPDTGQCIGNGNKCGFFSGGQGNGISGTVDLRSSGVSFQGNAGSSITGRLIANSLNMQVSGRVGSGLALSGTISNINTNTCTVMDATVNGTSTVTSPTGRVVVQSQCGTSSSLSGVVDFNYTP